MKMDRNDEDWSVDCSDDEKYEVDSKVRIFVSIFHRTEIFLSLTKIFNLQKNYQLNPSYLIRNIHRMV